MSLSATIPVADRSPGLRTGLLALVFLEFLVAGALAARLSVVPDVAWLLTVGERMLDGAVLYRDVLEANPPLSVWLYLPVIGLARTLSVAPEALLPAYVMFVAAVAIWGSGRILLAAGLVRQPEGWWAIAGAVLLLLPIGIHAQREQIAVALALPLFAAVAARTAGSPVGVTGAVAAGIAGGIGLAVKPHFVLALALPVLVEAARARSLRPLFSAEVLAAAATVAAYGIAVPILHPDFVFAFLPVLADVYLPLRASPLALLGTMAAVGVLLTGAGTALAWGRQVASPLPRTFLLASVGYLLAYLLQGKGWGYQALPAAILVVITFGLGLVRRFEAGGRIAPATAMAVVVAAFGFGLVQVEYVTPFDSKARYGRLVWTFPGASLATITSDISLGHPLVRELGGRWVGSTAYRLVAFGAQRTLEKATTAEERDHLQALVAEDRAALARDLATGRPDLILAHRQPTDWLAWAREDAATARILDGYRLVERIDLTDLGLGIVSLLVREDLARARSLSDLEPGP